MSSKIKTYIGAALVILIFSGCKPPPIAIATESWKDFVTDTRAELGEGPAFTLVYDKLHEYEGRFFGVQMIGNKGKEYAVAIFRFDPESKEWDSPRIAQEDIDMWAAVSKQWDVPKATIQEWLDEANRTVKEMHSKLQ